MPCNMERKILVRYPARPLVYSPFVQNSLYCDELRHTQIYNYNKQIGPITLPFILMWKDNGQIARARFLFLSAGKKYPSFLGLGLGTNVNIRALQPQKLDIGYKKKTGDISIFKSGYWISNTYKRILGYV